MLQLLTQVIASYLNHYEKNKEYQISIKITMTRF